ncbi:MAG: SIS domain-containing protein [Promethearchaeota archaeon]
MIVSESYLEILKDGAKSMVNGIKHSINIYDPKSIINFLEIMVNAYYENKKIVVSGEGNSGSVGEIFVRRCTHLKYSIWFLKDASCPAIKSKDIAIFISGTGITSGVLNQAKIARQQLDATVILITSKKREQNSPDDIDSIQNYADLVIEIGGKTKEQKIQQYKDFGSRQIAGDFSKPYEITKGVLVLGTQFEINAFVFLLSLTHALMDLLNKTEDSLKHKNIE